MAISRDNAEIVAKEIQISLNLFERAEHVLNDILQLMSLRLSESDCKLIVTAQYFLTTLHSQISENQFTLM